MLNYSLLQHYHHSTWELGSTDTWDCMIGFGWKLVIFLHNLFIIVATLRYAAVMVFVQTSYGCSLVTPLSCEASKNQILLELKYITYFPFSTDPLNINPDHRGINLENCKQACLKNCSCNTAIYNSSNHVENYYLQSNIFSLMSIDEEMYTYFKVYITV